MLEGCSFAGIDFGQNCRNSFFLHKFIPGLSYRDTLCTQRGTSYSITSLRRFIPVFQAGRYAIAYRNICIAILIPCGVISRSGTVQCRAYRSVRLRYPFITKKEEYNDTSNIYNLHTITGIYMRTLRHRGAAAGVRHIAQEPLPPVPLEQACGPAHG